jgi:spermidine synthase
MVPRILIDTAQVPGGGEMRLFQRGDDFSITLGANELMNSRLSGSEEALATLVCDRLGVRDRLGVAPAPRLLIGGLGMGFTLRAALGRVGPDAAVTVAELVPAVVAWARGPMAAIFAGSLEDRRVTVAEEDVVALIAGTGAGARGAWDAILLDVDNGPDGLTRRGNNRLYSATGLDAARSALRPDGMLAVWSAAPDAKFVRRLETAGFAVEEVVVKARGGRGARHVIWLAKRL